LIVVLVCVAALAAMLPHRELVPPKQSARQPTLAAPPPQVEWTDHTIVCEGSQRAPCFTTADQILKVVVAHPPRLGTRLLVLTAEQAALPQPRGSHLYLLDPARPDQTRLLSVEPDYNFWDMSVGDVDGDGEQEVALCTYSYTARDPSYARRFFVYGWDGGNDLCPMWRGSRLCRPYLSAGLADVTGDDKAELVSVEVALSGKLLVVVYEWNQFGFWGLGHSVEYDHIQQVTPCWLSAGGKGIRVNGTLGHRPLEDVLTVSHGQLQSIFNDAKRVRSG